MSRNLMPKSGAMAPYIVVNRDAAVAGVFSVDGEAGSIVLTSKYLQISKYNLDQQELNTRLTGIDSSIKSNTDAIGNINIALGSMNTTIASKAAKGANNDITELNALTKAITLAQGGTGATDAYGARTNIGLAHLTTGADRAYMSDPTSTNYLFVAKDGDWGVVKSGGTPYIPLPIHSGGTGATTAAEALVKLMDGKPLPLAADGQAPYDAVTVRQLANISGGGNASMSGVMNNFIGAVEWFNGNRTKLPAGYIPADGQLVSRTDNKTADLWSAVSGGLFYAVSDALWISSGDPVRPYAWRASYSTGDGSTTFRVPDLNGTQLNSLKHLFLSGSSGATNEPSANQVWNQAAPNITGAFAGGSTTTGKWLAPVIVGDNSQALFVKLSPDSQMAVAAHGTDLVTSNNYVALDASRSNKTYGRGNAYQNDPGGTGPMGDLYPNHATGIWIIRANGSYSAAKTAYHVINGDTARPADGTTTYGGFVHSQYRIGETVNHTALVVSGKRFGTNYSTAVLQALNNENGDLANLEVQSNGVVNLPTSINNKSWVKAFGSAGLHLDAYTTAKDMHTLPGGGCGVSGYERNDVELNNPNAGIGNGAYVNWLKGNWYDAYYMLGGTRGAGTNLTRFLLRLKPDQSAAYYDWSFEPGGSVTAMGPYNNVSDIRTKTDIVKVTNALEAVTNWNGVTFNKLGNKTREVGIIAQDIEPWCPEAISITTTTDSEGNVLEDMKSVNYSGLTAAYHTEAIKELVGIINEMKDTISDLKAEIEQLKAK